MIVTQFTIGYLTDKLAKNSGICLRTIKSWVAKFIAGGMNAINDKPRTGRPRIITDEQARWIFDTVVNKTPEQLQFEFA